MGDWTKPGFDHNGNPVAVLNLSTVPPEMVRRVTTPKKLIPNGHWLQRRATP